MCVTELLTGFVYCEVLSVKLVTGVDCRTSLLVILNIETRLHSQMISLIVEYYAVYANID